MASDTESPPSSTPPTAAVKVYQPGSSSVKEIEFSRVRSWRSFPRRFWRLYSYWTERWLWRAGAETVILSSEASFSRSLMLRLVYTECPGSVTWLVCPS